ncbi:MAG: nucleotide exchange factor GrpE [Myxococcales bacterium]|nr:nucleotide exchange factor GrpE [Myxococcales bacterium]|tara:strand:+ start:475 stop:1176 length:702 start_codon:yes stop_codon:yes gene_type:complete
MNGNTKDNDPVVIHLSEEAKKMQEEQGQASETETNSPNASQDLGDAILNDDDGFGAFAPIDSEEPSPQEDGAVELSPEDLQPLEEEPSALQQKINQLEEYARRQTADFQNYRKQVQKETSQAVEQAEDKVFSEWLEVMDNFERALTNINEEDSPWISGMQAIFKHMLYTLERHDITPIEAKDQPFDPNWHEAISMIQDPEKENDIISQVVQTGYVRKGRLLRAARVVVVKNED